MNNDEKREWLSMISLCLGIASIFLWEFSIVPILAILFGTIGLVRENRKWLAGIGLVLGILFVIVRISQGHIDGIFSSTYSGNGAQQTTTRQETSPIQTGYVTPSTTSITPTSPSQSITNPDYLKNPSAYLVDYDNKISSEIPTEKALWIEEIKNSVTLRISYTIVKTGSSIIVFHDLQIPGLSTDIYGESIDKQKPNPCREKAAIDFLTSNLLHTEVYLAYEGIRDNTTTWRLLMPAENGKDTVDVALFIIASGYGKVPFWSFYGGKSDGIFFRYPDYVPPRGAKLSSPAGDLTDAQAVARLAERGFWGTCQ